jgi:hypothetical protein
LLLIGMIFLLGAPQKIFQYYDRFTASNAFPDSYRGRWILAKFTLEKIRENPFRMSGFGQRSFAKQNHEFI